MSTTAQREFYSRLKREGRLHGTIKRAMELWAKRVRQTESAPPDVRRHRRPIPIGTCHAGRARQAAKAAYPRRENWEYDVVPSTARYTTGWRVREIDNGRYSSRCTYTHWTYRVCATSYGYVLCGVLRWRIGTKTGIEKAPHGYRWNVDRNGIRLVSLRDNRCDYHPDSDDILALTPRQMAAEARENLAIRIKAGKATRETVRAIRTAEREGAVVRMADSLAAGNCRAGTQQWCYRHKIDPGGYYRPSQLLALANGDTDRVRLVVAKALQRHKQDMRQGFCKLA